MANISDYLSKIPSENAQQPNFLAMLTLFIQPFVDNQNVWASIPTLLGLNTATQYALPVTNFAFDFIGEWVGVGRNGLSDAEYQIVLQAQIAINHWDGTIPGIYEIWNTVFSGGVVVLVQDNQDMSMFIVFVTLPPTFNSTILALLRAGQFDLRPAGVKMLGHFKPSTPGEPVFACDIENAQMAGCDVGYFVEAI